MILFDLFETAKGFAVPHDDFLMRTDDPVDIALRIISIIMPMGNV